MLNVDEPMVQQEFIKANMPGSTPRYKPEFLLQMQAGGSFLTPEQYLQELDKQYRPFNPDEIEITVDNVNIKQEDFFLPNLISCYVIADYDLTFIHRDKTLFKRRCRAYCLFPKISVSISVKLMQVEPVKDIVAYNTSNQWTNGETATVVAKDEPALNNGLTYNSIRINGYEAVDLGLSVKWAAYDLGATHSREYGKRYAWGENIHKETFTNKNSLTYNKKHYNTNVKNISGSKIHDAARAVWGLSWRMPTKAEFQELIDKCKWIEQPWGYQVIGPNGNSIEFYFWNSYKRYWLADLDETSTKKEAYYGGMIKNERPQVFERKLFKAVRWAGLYIRPVTD